MAAPSSIRAAAEQLRRRQLRVVDLLGDCLDRIDRYEEKLGAWVSVDRRGAEEQARALDAELQTGEPRSPLHGIPIGIKDIIDVRGCPTLAGSPLREGHIAEADAPAVARLRAAGAILLGKTVTTEFAFLDPPPTRNPWNPARTPGGSSSGSCAAVAAGMCLAALGTQTGGSITRPATYCGIAGCKPTYGRVSLAGIVPLSFHLDHPGPVARRVDDLALVLSVIADGDAAREHVQDETACDLSSGALPSTPPRIGVLGGFFAEAAAAEVRAAVSTALEKLQRAGAVLVDTLPPARFAEVIENHRRIMAVDAATAHRDNFPEHRAEYGRQIAAILDEGRSVPAIDYAAALAHRRLFSRDIEELLGGFDVLLTPAAPNTAPTPETTGDGRFNSPWSYVGLPTVSLPCGLAADRLPVGLQLIGRRWGEAALFSTAAWCEQQIGFDAVPPL